MPITRHATCLVALTLCAGTAVAQSDPALFDSVIQVPGDQPAIGGGVGANTQLNLSDGGVILQSFDAGLADGSGTNTEINIFGGTIGDAFTVYGGTVVNVSGGEFEGAIDVRDGAVLNLNVFEVFLGFQPVELMDDGALVIEQRDVALAALLADGSLLTLDLNSVSTGATLTATLVPSPTGIGLLVVAGPCRRRRRAG